MTSRRMFLSGAGTGVVLGLGDLKAQGRPDWIAKVSPAVLAGAHEAMMNIHRKAPANFIGSDFRSLSTASTVFFNHLNEIGCTPAFEALLRSRPGFFTTTPTVDQIQAVRSQCEKSTGVKMPEGRFRTFSGTIEANWYRLGQQLGSGTLHSALIEFPADMRTAANRLDQERGQPIAQGRVIQANWVCDAIYWYNTLMAIWGLLLGINFFIGGEALAVLAAFLADPVVLAVAGIILGLGWIYGMYFC
jgi:hypothetical protein